MKISQFVLYHGSDTNVRLPRHNAGSRYRDFGQCFYTTYDKTTAVDWAEKMTINPVISKFALNLKSCLTSCFRIKRFNADAEWAKFVYDNREVESFVRPSYDIIIGPIADKGLQREFLKVKSGEKTFEEIAQLIHYDRYCSYQVAFCTEKSLRLLSVLD